MQQLVKLQRLVSYVSPSEAKFARIFLTHLNKSLSRQAFLFPANSHLISVHFIQHLILNSFYPPALTQLSGF